MIKVIAGEKGTGKTAQLVDMINEQATTDNNIVCIQRGHRLDRLIKYSVRLVDLDEYPVEGFEQFLSFVAGICAKDYDVTHIYVDSILKITGETDYDRFAAFLEKFNEFLGDKITATIICSRAADVLPESVTKYC
ncbi:MAG: hypothetical protein IKI87_08085 [Clostridiales bacterium]|nr:hypothetical protein [Clostridiales bacterium]